MAFAVPAPTTRSAPGAPLLATALQMAAESSGSSVSASTFSTQVSLAAVIWMALAT